MGRRYTALVFTMRDKDSNAKIPLRLRPSDKIELLDDVTVKQEMQCLYVKDGIMYLMDAESFEQIEVSVDLCGPGDAAQAYLQDSMTVSVEKTDNAITGVQLPATMVCTVTSCDTITD